MDTSVYIEITIGIKQTFIWITNLFNISTRVFGDMYTSDTDVSINAFYHY